MIYTDSQLKEKIVRMIESFENEVVEFKEARTNYLSRWQILSDRKLLMFEIKG